ncbi:MAG: response regulator [Halobacteriota archaeon]|nr:response regulator [Halobacteriota archaeon]
MSEKLHILIVDDDYMMTKTLADIINTKGHEAESAHSGHEALEKMVDGNFDCVLSDIKMPDINGVELYKAIKAMWPSIPVVMMTAYASDNMVNEGLKNGVINVMIKPLNINLLLCFLISMEIERSILIVDDDPCFCSSLGDILMARGFNVTQFDPIQDIIKSIREKEKVGLLIMKMRDKVDLKIYKDIRRAYTYLHIILIVGTEDTDSSEVAIAIGKNSHTHLLPLSDYSSFYKPSEREKLLGLITEIQNQELSRVFVNLQSRGVD